MYSFLKCQEEIVQMEMPPLKWLNQKEGWDLSFGEYSFWNLSTWYQRLKPQLDDNFKMMKILSGRWQSRKHWGRVVSRKCRWEKVKAIRKGKWKGVIKSVWNNLKDTVSTSWIWSGRWIARYFYRYLFDFFFSKCRTKCIVAQGCHVWLPSWCLYFFQTLGRLLWRQELPIS